MRQLALTLLVVALPAGAGISSTADGKPLIPSAIAFWDAQHGLVGGNAGGCPARTSCAGWIWATTDGGVRTQLLVRTSGPVESLSVAPGGAAWAVVDRCSRDRCVAAQLLASSDWGATWTQLPRVVLRPSFADARFGFAVSGPCFPVWCYRARLLATDDSGRSWERVPNPCSTSLEAVARVSVDRAWLLCTSEPGAGSQGKTMYRTDDGGRSWRLLFSNEVRGKPVGGISQGGYALGISFSPNGVGLLWESRGTLYLTRDGGRHWTGLPAVSSPEVDFDTAGSVVPGKAFALLTGGAERPRLVATTRGYSAWKTVRTFGFRP
jgi:photosystem II stability/assembly factor-like uncharacterized protein